ncbi:ROK family protein [Nocardia nova]|uniref:ROK family protein n=1 Tax=Nocardia nova TaxID=37330 RepID=UPI0033E8CBCF
MIVFDLGGTWWRSAVLAPDDSLINLTVHPAVTWARTGSNAATLRALMVKFLLDETRRLLERHADARSVGISLGAAINEHTGRVLASAPLWGDCTDPFDMRAELAAAQPDLQWWIINDVTSLALSIIAGEQARVRGLRAITAVTISSGIAARTIDVVSGEVQPDRRHGIQGEIGHLPAIVTAPARIEQPTCDCGAVGHVSALASGKAIERQLCQMADVLGLGDHTGDECPSRLARLRSALDTNSIAAESFLDSVTAPLARALLYVLAIDSRVDRVFLSGGVVDTLGDHYLASVYRTMESDGLYLTSTYQPSVFRDRISRLESDGLAPLRGAGLFARKQSQPAGARWRG